jgi:hypothetical protein
MAMIPVMAMIPIMQMIDHANGQRIDLSHGETTGDPAQTVQQRRFNTVEAFNG